MSVTYPSPSNTASLPRRAASAAPHTPQSADSELPPLLARLKLYRINLMNQEFIDAHKESLKTGIREPKNAVERNLFLYLSKKPAREVKANIGVGMGFIVSSVVCSLSIIGTLLCWGLNWFSRSAALTDASRMGCFVISGSALVMLSAMLAALYLNRLAAMEIITWKRVPLKKWRQPVPTTVQVLARRVHEAMKGCSLDGRVRLLVEYPSSHKLRDPILIIQYLEEFPGKHAERRVLEEYPLTYWV